MADSQAQAWLGGLWFMPGSLSAGLLVRTLEAGKHLMQETDARRVNEQRS